MPTGEEYLEKTRKVLQQNGVKVTVTVTKKSELKEPSLETKASNQLSQIATGWANVLFKDKVVEHLAEARMNICNVCSAFNKETNKCDSSRSVKHAKGYSVNGCGCPLQAKTRSPSSNCPAGKWVPVDIARYKLHLMKEGKL